MRNNLIQQKNLLTRALLLNTYEKISRGGYGPILDVYTHLGTIHEDGVWGPLVDHLREKIHG